VHDRLLLTANRHEGGFHATNGEMVTVLHVDEQRRVHLDDGRALPTAYKHFDHGYAVTAHRSQGQSVDAVVIAGETMSRELFYVAASCGRERLTVITSDKALLQESVGQSSARLSASELVRTRHAQLAESLTPNTSRGFERGIRMIVEERRQSVGLAHESPGHAVPAPVRQQVAQHATGQERGGQVQQLQRGHGLGIGPERPWSVDRERRPYSVGVVLQKRTYVLPWSQFLYAEGAPDAVRAVFSMHDVVVTGRGLDALLTDLAVQAVTVIQLPRVESFVPAAGPRIVAVDVRRIEGSGPS
jgi:hypothetical protein